MSPIARSATGLRRQVVRMAIDTIERTHHGASDSTKLFTIDTDIHHGIHSKSDLFPYLSKVVAERFNDYGLAGGNLYAYNGGVRGHRADVVDAQSPGGLGAAATNIERTIEDIFDGCGVDIGILTGSSVYSAASMPDLDYASEISRAFNDFTIWHWLARDARFRFWMAVCPQDPQQAAAEIGRIGDHPGIVAIIMPCGAPRAFGQRFYTPIYEACERHNLSFAMPLATE